MSEQRFKQALIVLGLAMLVIVGSMFSSAAPGPSKPYERLPVKVEPSAPDQLANQLIDRVKVMKDRAMTACSGVVANIAQCKAMREAANVAYSKVVTSAHLLDRDGLLSLSRAIDTAETEVYPNLRTLEESSKIIENILSGR